MVGNANIDPMWIWAWDEGCTKCSRPSGPRSSGSRRIPTSTSPPARPATTSGDGTSTDLFDRIRDSCAPGAGSSPVANGWSPTATCSGESVCRQLLYGQRYLAGHVGVTAAIGYNVDSFGHAGTLPQLLAASGITSYVFMRPGPDEKGSPPPPSYGAAPMAPRSRRTESPTNTPQGGPARRSSSAPRAASCSRRAKSGPAPHGLLRCR